MKFTVALCTLNGASRIGATLESLVCLERAKTIAWELLIVDNDSADNTRQVCESYSSRLPLRIVTESKQGHSNCRNSAIENSRGEYIVWTDDDVVVDPGWLSQYDRGVDKYPKGDFWGGRIRVRFADTVPNWVHQNWDVCAGVFAERDLGNEEFEIATAEQLPYGANFVTRRNVQKNILFDTKFGRSGTSVRGFDEIDVLSKMLALQHIGYWIPGAIVDHVIQPNRTTLQYVGSYFEGQGQTWISRRFSKLDLKQIEKKLRYHELLYRLTRLGPSKIWFPHWVQASNLRGQKNELELNSG